MPDHDSQLNGSAVERKRGRITKACDACRLRKVKCTDGFPCRPCRMLELPCTFDRPSKRKGPPNKIAAALKNEDESTNGYLDDIQDSPDRLTPDKLTAESIGPLPVVESLVDYYFMYIHPLHPIPHEPSFRKDLAERRDTHDRYFLALLASMIGALVACYPRKPRQRLRHLEDGYTTGSAVDFINHCQSVCLQARGYGYLDKADVNSVDAMTSYLLSITYAYTYRWATGGLYLGECYNINRTILTPAPSLRTMPGPLVPMQETKIDCIETEMVRRVFWLVFVTHRSNMTTGNPFGHITMLPPSLNNPYPELPSEVDDEFISESKIDTPQRGISLLSGFLLLIGIYRTQDGVMLNDVTNVEETVVDVQKRQIVLTACYEQLSACMSQARSPFASWIDSSSELPRLADLHLGKHNSALDGHLTYKRETALKIQKANIYTAYMSTRSYFVENYWNLFESLRWKEEWKSPELAACVANAVDWICTERRSAATDLLEFLSSFEQMHFEPNGLSLVLKIRQIASTILPESSPCPHHISHEPLPLTKLFFEYIRQFLQHLLDLERGYRPGFASMSSDRMQTDEEEDLRRWANLRESQRAYVAQTEVGFDESA